MSDRTVFILLLDKNIIVMVIFLQRVNMLPEASVCTRKENCPLCTMKIFKICFQLSLFNKKKLKKQ